MKTPKGTFTKGLLAILVAAALVIGGAAAPRTATAALPAPTWMPGFPMLAGPQVILMWAPVPGAVKYNLYMNGQKVAEAMAMQHIAPAPTTGGEYSYTVTAVDAAGAEGPPSQPQVIRIIIVMPPKGLAALPQPERITIRWNATEGAVIYDVFRREKGKQDYKLLGSVTDTRFDDAQVESGVNYEYAVKSKDSTGKSSEYSEILEATPFVAKETLTGGKRLEFKVHALPTRMLYRADLPQYPADSAICGNRAVVSAYTLWMVDNVTAPEAFWNLVPIIPNEKQFLGVAWDEDCETVYAVNEPQGKLFVIDPDGTTGETRGAILARYDLPIPPDGPPETEGTLYFLSVDMTGKEVTRQTKSKVRPSDVVIDRDGNFVVGDLDNNRFLLLNPEGEFIETMLYDQAEEINNDPTWFITKPMSMTYGTDGKIYATSLNKILAVDPVEGTKTAIGGPGTVFGTFTSVKGAYLDKKNNMYVTDGRAGNIQVFQNHEGYGWVPVYIVTNEKKDANLQTLTPQSVMLTDDLKLMFLTESMSKTVSVHQVLWDKADPVELPPLQ
ncbi:MAG: hypothetical protein JSV00_07130 [bacterium]|nr:MAG: hypothetical protein JSV00_07130 [bacterium]